MPRCMRIAFFGSSLVSAYWNGAATYYRGIISALHRLGHTIRFYEPDAYERQQHRDIPDPDWAKVVVYEATLEGVYQALEDAYEWEPDLVVKASGVGVFDGLLEKEVFALRKPGNQVAFWDVDAPATLDRLRANPQDPFRALVPRYDFIFTYGGGPPVIKAYIEAGAKNCHPIYNALDPSTHYPVPPEPRFESDFAFLGNRLPDREARVEEFFIKPASLLTGRRFLLGGNGWDGKPFPDNVRYLGHVYTKDHNAFNCTPLAVLNISRESMARYGYSPATRVFEAAGAGACIITDKWEGIDFFMEPEKEILVAEDAAEVARILEGLTPERARRIGQAGKARILGEHTYAHRAMQFESILGVSRREAECRGR